MTRQILLTIALLLTLDTADAVRVIEQVEHPVELVLGDLTLPATADGDNISFSECPTCGISTHRLTTATVYKVNRQTVAFADFLRLVAEIRQKPDGNTRSFAGVFLDIASGRVTRVEVLE
jgi:hypothetical protein